MDNRGKIIPYVIRFSLIAGNEDTSDICIKEFIKHGRTI